MTRRTAEETRLVEDRVRERNWKRWGTYLSERQWGTVREDYSPSGECWDYFSHDQARSRAYRWGEDGLFGWSDRQCRLCFALALWNGKDPILKERLYGLTGPEGNHGEDVKELYYYLDATPTHSYAKALYKYPHGEYPYERLVEENRRRGREAAEYELSDTGALADNRYFDVFVEYAKAHPEDILARFTIVNRGPEQAVLHVLPTLWFRNTWSWGRQGEGYWQRPTIERAAAAEVLAEHPALGPMRCRFQQDAGGPELLFTENETNYPRLYQIVHYGRYKDAFHDYVVLGQKDALSAEASGTKVAAHYVLTIPAGGSVTLRARLSPEGEELAHPFGAEFDRTVENRLAEADLFYEQTLPAELDPEQRKVARQAYAGLIWSKQFYHYVVRDWLEGDAAHPPPPPERNAGRNAEWKHVYNRDLISMPDKWEYPWYAAWDLAFHMVPYATVDPDFAKSQLVLFLREWYMHPNGQIPAYEFAFGDVNPPVHAWSAWMVYQATARAGHPDRSFLARVFQKLLLNFTWWVNRKDDEGNNLFSGGFLGLDNIGVFDRSQPLPTGGHLEQADGTAWMAFYAMTMLEIALELAREDHTYEDLASKFFEHFVAIVDAMNTLGGSGLWDEEDGFYYDQLHFSGGFVPLRIRSMVGVIPLFAVGILEDEHLDRLPGFKRRMQWFMHNRSDLARHIAYFDTGASKLHRLLAVPSRERLIRVLRYLLDENEFLSPFGLRSLSRVHREHPYTFWADGRQLEVKYAPAESTTGLFGGNSNWRGPVWFPLNYLLVQSLREYHQFYGPGLKVECPTGSGRMLTLAEVAAELATRLSRLFLPDPEGRRPCHGSDARYARDPAFRDLVLFYEYFHGDDGRGLGASHQTGWTALVASCLDHIGEHRRSG
jgi:Mannosylglycerate hydrolase MGH1-like glycoside hydrolase domain